MAFAKELEDFTSTFNASRKNRRKSGDDKSSPDAEGNPPLLNTDMFQEASHDSYDNKGYGLLYNKGGMITKGRYSC